MGPRRNEIPLFNGRQGDEFPLWQLRVELELKKKRVFGEVAAVPGAVASVPAVVAAVTAADDSDDSADDASVVPSEAGSAQVLMTPEERRDLAAFIIVSNLGNRVLRAVSNLRHDPRLMWKRLQDRYAASTLTSKLSLQEKFLTTKMQPKSDVREHISTIEACVVQLADMGEQLSEGMQLTTLVNSVSHDYEAVVTAMRTLQDDLTWDNCVARLIDEGDRQKANRQNGRQSGRGGREQGGPSGSRALKVGTAKETRKFFSCNKRGHLSADCQEEDQRLEDEDRKEKKSKAKVAKKKKPSRRRKQDE